MKLQLQTRLKKETEHRSKNRKELSSSRSKLSIFNQHLSSDQKVVGEVAVPALVSNKVRGVHRSRSLGYLLPLFRKLF